MCRLEENLGIIAASVFTIRLLFRRFRPITRIHSATADDRFARNGNFSQAKSKAHSSATLEGSVIIVGGSARSVA